MVGFLLSPTLARCGDENRELGRELRMAATSKRLCRRGAPRILAGLGVCSGFQNKISYAERGPKIRYYT